MKIVVLVSGSGSNLQALIDAQKNNKNPSYKIALVIADRENCYALERATKAGIKTAVVQKKGSSKDEKRDFISNEILKLAKENSCDAIVLAGFLTILCGKIIEEYKNKIINLHPSLLPKFGGKGMWGINVHRAVLEAGEKESGCTIHLVDAGCDTGKILLQKKVPVLNGDTAEQLAKRIAKQEHLAIVEGVKILAGRILNCD